ncbi:hypothetical protein H310_14644 [Aphanomyces invadans]|uniref:Uncharacterized protein n=1 Tax=Aphanomyces invadans TaxID=157072 RepID=A0A024T990_9STRA|nr:hypothetical protein H310_14644 [Aphanomyces invadans]ETV90608.1 hypothetical protein H310_14644 [Aphanomyces invadans]|eukprot:XP_008880761.1 hypothetical protein H310_14644 [Aphanomyces invadans]
MDISVTDADSPRALQRKRDLDYRIQHHANSPEQREPESAAALSKGATMPSSSKNRSTTYSIRTPPRVTE